MTVNNIFNYILNKYYYLESFIYSILNIDRLKYYKFLYYQHRYANKLHKKEKIKVVFLAMNLAMWKYQHLYELMRKHKRFEPYIVLSPAVPFSIQQKEKDLDDLRTYFTLNNTPFFDFEIKDGNYNHCDIQSIINPDIIFYPQPYEHILVPEHHYRLFLDKLICYYPYAFWTSKGKWSYDSFFHNHAWKLFYSTQLNYLDAKNVAYNKGRNVVVTGYPVADDYLKISHKDVWKPQNKKKYKVIWAPHFTIEKGITSLYMSNFLWMADLMLEIAEKYKDVIQFAFKPHPRLMTELYKNKIWGEKRTNEYYEEWHKRNNTQLETGNYIDLFMTSDAMIHDSSSFIIEYLYTRNPVMFICNDIKRIREEKNDLGNKALDCLYIGRNADDIETFLCNVIKKGIDEKKSLRNNFYHEFLLPPNGKTVAQNTMDDLLKSLRIK